MSLTELTLSQIVKKLVIFCSLGNKPAILNDRNGCAVPEKGQKNYSLQIYIAEKCGGIVHMPFKTSFRGTKKNKIIHISCIILPFLLCIRKHHLW